jgi:hypothetical protein
MSENKEKFSWGLNTFREKGDPAKVDTYKYDISKSFLGETISSTTQEKMKCVYVPIVWCDDFDINTIIWLSDTKEFKDKWPNIHPTGEWKLSPEGGKTEFILFFYD